MKRYARDMESAACAALDWATFLFARLNRPDIGKLLQKEKHNFINCENHALKKIDMKSVLEYTRLRLADYNYHACSIVFDNHLVPHFGELDDVEPKNMNAKRAIDYELKKRAEISTEEEIWKKMVEEKKILMPKT